MYYIAKNTTGKTYKKIGGKYDFEGMVLNPEKFFSKENFNMVKIKIDNENVNSLIIPVYSTAFTSFEGIVTTKNGSTVANAKIFFDNPFYKCIEGDVRTDQNGKYITSTHLPITEDKQIIKIGAGLEDESDNVNRDAGEIPFSKSGYVERMFVSGEHCTGLNIIIDNLRYEYLIHGKINPTDAVINDSLRIKLSKNDISFPVQINENGEYSAKLAEPGRYLLSIQTALIFKQFLLYGRQLCQNYNGLFETIEMNPQDKDIVHDVNLTKSSFVAGKVIYENGDPVFNATVKRAGNFESAEQSKTNGKGIFFISCLAEGSPLDLEVCLDTAPNEPQSIIQNIIPPNENIVFTLKNK